MNEFVAKWHGRDWTALLSREPYGLHFSVGADGRPPSDQQVRAALLEHERGSWPEQPMWEITDWHREQGALNPWVRHFAPEQHALRIRASGRGMRLGARR